MYFRIPQQPMISLESHSEIPLIEHPFANCITLVGSTNYMNNWSPLF